MGRGHSNLHFTLGYSLPNCKDDYVDVAQLEQQRETSVVSVIPDPSALKENQLLSATSQPAPGCDIYISDTNTRQTQFYLWIIFDLGGGWVA